MTTYLKQGAERTNLERLLCHRRRAKTALRAGWTLEGGRGKITISLFVMSLCSEAHIILALTKSKYIHSDEKSSKQVKNAREPDSITVSNVQVA